MDEQLTNSKHLRQLTSSDERQHLTNEAQREENKNEPTRCESVGLLTLRQMLGKVGSVIFLLNIQKSK